MTEVSKPNIWFRADDHLGHENMIKYDNESLETYFGYKPRPYYSVEEMDEDAIEKHNSVVAPTDHVYYVGDHSLDKSAGRASANLYRMNGIKYLIYGNHRSTDEQLKSQFQWCRDLYELKVPDSDAYDGQQQSIILCHYPILEWKNAHRGAWHLYGHVHMKYEKWKSSGEHSHCDDRQKKLRLAVAEYIDQYKSIDIGIMGHGMMPISYEEVKNIMAKKIIMQHHA